MTNRNLSSPLLFKRKRLALLPVVAVLAATTLWADQVVLKNGDRVTGSIVKKDGNALTIDSAHFGTITMPWDEVESVIADTPLNVVLPGDQTVRATLQTRTGQI